MERPRVISALLLTAAALVVPSSFAVPPLGADSAKPWWHPGPSTFRWQWELDHPLRPTSAKDIGTNDTLPNHKVAPPPSVYDIDGIDNSAATVAALHHRGDRAICYVEVGAAGNYYSSRAEGIPTTYYAQLRVAGDLGQKVNGYPERFVDINRPSTVSIVESMIKKQCADKGFDGVETDLDETYSGAEGVVGFPLREADEITYMKTLADFLHGLGLAWIAKNPDDTGDNFATLIAPFADGVLTEQCNQYATCSALDAFIGHKAIFNAEYHLATPRFCVADKNRHINGIAFTRALNGARHPCQ